MDERSSGLTQQALWAFRPHDCRLAITFLSAAGCLVGPRGIELYPAPGTLRAAYIDRSRFRHTHSDLRFTSHSNRQVGGLDGASFAGSRVHVGRLRGSTRTHAVL